MDEIGTKETVRNLLSGVQTYISKPNSIAVK